MPPADTCTVPQLLVAIAASVTLGIAFGMYCGILTASLWWQGDAKRYKEMNLASYASDRKYRLALSKHKEIVQ